jgi:mono/diheme cytochrome c family protein
MSQLTLFIAFWICGFLAGCATQPPPQQKAFATQVQQEVQLIHSVEGVDLFRSYCAPCHGLDGKGHGVMAPALKTKVADLTVLAKNNHGQFPAERVRGILNGDPEFISHGSREMPIWGPIFHQVENDMDWGNVRLANLVKYLQSIQQGPDPTGAQLFGQYCAACHGGDLKGTGPVPEPYQSPPDLTTLARRNGGRFPEANVLDVLRNGVVIPAHGLADMPAWGTDSRLMDINNPGQVSERINELVKFIKSKQVK